MSGEPRKESTSPQSEQLMVVAARMYYEHGMTHQEIAAELDLSRVKITRMLSRARSMGIVQITINGEAEPFENLARVCANTFGLSNVWIAPVSDNAERAAHSMAITGARAIRHFISRAQIVTLGLSRTVASAVTVLSEHDAVISTADANDHRRSGTASNGPTFNDLAQIGFHRAGMRSMTPSGRYDPFGTLSDRTADSPDQCLTFVPSAGSIGAWLEGKNASELASKLAELNHGRALGLPVPLIAPNADVAASFARMNEVACPMSYAHKADTAFFGVGALDWETSPLTVSLTADERDELTRMGAVGDLSGRFFDHAGRELTEASFHQRVLSLDLDSYRTMRHRVLFACGEAKIPAIMTLLQAKLVTALVTDTSTARTLLRLAHRR